jgi:hypothetical protein
MKDIVSILVDGIFIKFPGQNKLRMEFHGWNIFWLETTWNFVQLLCSSGMNFI